MSQIILPKKPKYGSPCNGCGLCCALELCGVAEMAFPGAKAPCPALKIVENRAICSLVATEIIHKLEPVLQTVLAIGQGCTMTDDPLTATT